MRVNPPMQPANNESGCLTLLLQILGLKPLPLPYKPLKTCLNKSELMFYTTLQTIVGKRAIILCKIRIADVLSVPRGDGYYKHFNRIAMKHVDFLLCDSETSKPLIAIEIDGGSHQRTDRQERDEFVDRAFQAAGIPLAHFPAKPFYEDEEIKLPLRPFLI